MSVREQLEQSLARIPGVVRRPARRGHGFSYHTDSSEIAHFHGDERLDVRLTKGRIGQRIAERGFDDRVRVRGPSAEWIAVRVSALADVPFAVSLVEEAVEVNSGVQKGTSAPAKRSGQGEKNGETL